MGQIPVTYNHRTGSGYNSGHDPNSEGVLAGRYIDSDYSPLYTFGHGLSYTSFALSDFYISPESVATDGELRISCTVKNTGARSGDVTVQLYTRFRGAHVVRPVKQLSGFKRIPLEPDQKATLQFLLKCSQLGFYNENYDFVVEPGILDIMIGTSAEEIQFTKSVSLTGVPAFISGKRSYTCPVSVEKKNKK